MKIIRFYLISFGFTWLIWLSGIFFTVNIISPTLLVSIGGLGPVIGILVYLISAEKNERVDYYKRLFRIKGFSFCYWIFTILIPLVAIMVATIYENIKLSHVLVICEIDPVFIGNGLSYAIFLLIFGPIPEEMAWRGIAFNDIAKKGVLKAQLIVAILWAVWHLPLFFVKGSYQNGLGLFTIEFWLFFANIIFLSIITGWLYTKSNSSILIAIIFHYIVNLTGEMFVLGIEGEIIRTLIFCAISLFIIAFYKPSNMGIRATP